MKTKTAEEKPIHIKPSLYAFYFYDLKVIAKKYGYNLVLHGSMNRDLDLVAIPWVEKLGDYKEMIKEFAIELGGVIMRQTEEQIHCFPHNRISQIINIRRHDPQSDVDLAYYMDISIILTGTQQVTAATEEMQNELSEVKRERDAYYDECLKNRVEVIELTVDKYELRKRCEELEAQVPKWHYTGFPICCETGPWDGKRSDFVLAVFDGLNPITARVYSGVMDGSEFADWYDADDNPINAKIVKWMYLPNQ